MAHTTYGADGMHTHIGPWRARALQAWARVAEFADTRTHAWAAWLMAHPVLVPALQRYFLRWYTYVALYTLWLLTGVLHVALDRPLLYTLALYQRFLGGILVLAHVSVAVQILPLIGERGILSAQEHMALLHERLAPDHALWARFLHFPTLCWFGASDRFLRVKCGVGIMASMLFMIGVVPNVGLLVATIVYLSWKEIGRKFFQLQFDSLVLEAGYSAMLLYPIQLFSTHTHVGFYTYAELLVTWLLVIRLHVGSGACKIISGDATWRRGDAMTYHYWTTPVPNWLGWWAHQLPLLAHWLAVQGHFVIELLAVFLLFVPTHVTHLVGFVLVCALQGAIIFTGNFGSFNYLTAICAIPFLDDALLPRAVIAVLPGATQATWDWSLIGAVQSLLAVIHLATVVYLSLPIMWRFFSQHDEPATDRVHDMIVRSRWRDAVGHDRVVKYVGALSLVNYYGVFAHMTMHRDEIIIEGWRESTDATGVVTERGQWRTYELHYKPGRVDRAPPFLWPGHLPRFDWMLWFCALRKEGWTRLLALRLLQGADTVFPLFAYNPFPDATRPPTYVRFSLYSYRFSTVHERLRTGGWWVRNYKGAYDVTMRLDEQGRLLHAEPPDAPTELWARDTRLTQAWSSADESDYSADDALSPSSDEVDTSDAQSA